MPRFRKTVKGKVVFRALAVWVNSKLRASGMTLPEWAAKGYRPSAIGISKAAALRELQPLIPDAHEAYNLHGDSVKQYPTWEGYWEVLSNRIFYFFHRHEDNRVVPVVAEWPGKVSEDGLYLLPPSEEVSEPL